MQGQSDIDLNLPFHTGQNCFTAMTANPPSTARQRPPHAPASIAGFQRNARSLAALAVFTGSVLLVAAVPPQAAPAGSRAVVGPSEPGPELNPARTRSRIAAAPVAQDDDEDDEDDQDAQEADDGAPAEPVLEQIPVAPASEPQSLAVRDGTVGATPQVEGRPLPGQMHRLRLRARELRT